MTKPRPGVGRRLHKGWFMSDVERRARDFQYALERGYLDAEDRFGKDPKQVLDEIPEDDERR
ncbi:MAG: hypothetical protein ACOYEP_06075 [Limnochordia bacterium]